MNKIIIILFAFMLALKLNSKDLIMTTSYPLHLINQEVVGNLFESNSILGVGVSSKEFKQNTDIIFKLNKSKVLLYSSEINEDWIYDLPIKNKINLTELIPEEDRIFLTENDAEDFFWLDPKTTSIVVENLADTLGKIFPDKAADLKNNATKFLDKLELIDALIEKNLTNVERIPILQEDATLVYFASAYDFPIPFTINEIPDDELDNELNSFIETGVSQLLLNQYSKDQEKYNNIIEKYTFDAEYINVYGYKGKNYYDMMLEVSKIITTLYR